MPVLPTNVSLIKTKCWLVPSMGHRKNLSPRQDVEPLTSQILVGRSIDWATRDSWSELGHFTRSICDILQFETRKGLHLVFILRHFNYRSETWHFCSKSATAELEKANDRALRFVFNEKGTPSCQLLNKIGLSSLQNQGLAKNSLYCF